MLIAHISDLHILKDPRGKGAILESNATRLSQAIDIICALRPLPDIVVVTGDLSHEGLQEDYEYCRMLLEKLPCPFFVIPGNHDNRDLLREVFPMSANRSDAVFYQFESDGYPLRIIGIDSLEVGKVGGELCERRLGWIRETILGSHKPAVILMHHPPYSFGNVVNPAMQCVGGVVELAEIVRECGNIGAILCGHLHVHTNAVWNGVKTLTAPSVAPAFKLEIEGARLLGWSPSSPAFALHFFDERVMKTCIVRADEHSMAYPL